MKKKHFEIEEQGRGFAIQLKKVLWYELNRIRAHFIGKEEIKTIDDYSLAEIVLWYTTVAHFRINFERQALKENEETIKECEKQDWWKDVYKEPDVKGSLDDYMT